MVIVLSCPQACTQNLCKTRTGLLRLLFVVAYE